MPATPCSEMVQRTRWVGPKWPQRERRQERGRAREATLGDQFSYLCAVFLRRMLLGGPPFCRLKKLQRTVGALRAPTQAMATPPGHSGGRGSAEGGKAPAGPSRRRQQDPAGPSWGGGKAADIPAAAEICPAGTPLYLRWGSTALVDGDTETEPPTAPNQSPYLRGTPWPGELFRSPRGPRTRRRRSRAAAGTPHRA